MCASQSKHQLRLIKTWPKTFHYRRDVRLCAVDAAVGLWTLGDYNAKVAH